MNDLSFDDLIPQDKGQSISFDDLIPSKKQTKMEEVQSKGFGTSAPYQDVVKGLAETIAIPAIGLGAKAISGVAALPALAKGMDAYTDIQKDIEQRLTPQPKTAFGKEVLDIAGKGIEKGIETVGKVAENAEKIRANVWGQDAKALEAKTLGEAGSELAMYLAPFLGGKGAKPTDTYTKKLLETDIGKRAAADKAKLDSLLSEQQKIEPKQFTKQDELPFQTGVEEVYKKQTQDSPQQDLFSSENINRVVEQQQQDLDFINKERLNKKYEEQRALEESKLKKEEEYERLYTPRETARDRRYSEDNVYKLRSVFSDEDLKNKYIASAVASYGEQYRDVAAKLWEQENGPAQKPTTIGKQLAGLSGERLSISNQVKEWDYRGRRDERAIMQGVDSIKELAPTEEARTALTKDLENPAKRNSPEVKKARELFDDIWKSANEAGVVKGYVEDYITHMYDFGKQSNSSAIKAFYRAADEFSRSVGTGMGSKSPYALERKFKTLEEAFQQQGLVPRTTDAAEIYSSYASSMLKASNNKKFISDLKDVVNPATGEKLIKPIPKDRSVPRDYDLINSPQFTGLMVDKSISPTIRSMMENTQPSVITKAAYTMSMAAKAGIFSLSGFHIKSLGDAFLGTLRKTDTLSMKELYKQWREGGVGDIVDTALDGGLVIGHSPDMNMSIVSGAVKDVASAMDKMLPNLGSTIRLPMKAVDGLNKFLWNVVHPSFKLATWQQEYARLLKEGVESKKASEMAATFTNDIFGGLNWRRIAENTDSYLGYTLANEVASKRGQRALQIGLLAPDWTIATARSWEGAFRRASDPKEKAMYQKYVLQSAIIYAAVADLVNQQVTGHHFWENQDPTMIDLGNGRKMQLSKHFMEVPHWFLHPNQTMLNKIGFIPSEIFRQALNQDYLSASGASPKIVEKGTPLHEEVGQRVAHMAKGITPITLQQTIGQGQGEALAGFVGTPIYGKTEQQKAKDRAERAKKKRKQSK